MQLIGFLLLISIGCVNAFILTRIANKSIKNELKMNFFEDAVKFFANMNKEASAKHILIKGPQGSAKCAEIKESLLSAENISETFSEYAQKVILSLFYLN
jgi:hypothetical protein